jgi:hypothetical protein
MNMKVFSDEQKNVGPAILNSEADIFNVLIERVSPYTEATRYLFLIAESRAGAFSMKARTQQAVQVIKYYSEIPPQCTIMTTHLSRGLLSELFLLVAGAQLEQVRQCVDECDDSELNHMLSLTWSFVIRQANILGDPVWAKDIIRDIFAEWEGSEPSLPHVSVLDIIRTLDQSDVMLLVE